MSEYEKIQEKVAAIEGIVRQAFQAGQQFEKTLSGDHVALNDGPPNEDQYVNIVKQQVLTQMVIKMGEEALKQHHPSLHEEVKDEING